MLNVSRTAAVVLLVLLLGVCAGHAGNTRLMSVKMAQQDLKRNLVESVVGVKVKSEGAFGLTENANYQVDSKSAAMIKGVVVDECVYDQEKDVAMCTGHIDLDTVGNVVGERVNYKGVTVQNVGFGTMTESSRPGLRALRAALLSAYDELSTLLVGEKIVSQSSAENYILTQDSNRSKACAAIYGAIIPKQSAKFGKKGFGWESDGDAWVILQLDVRKVRDILGNTLKYTGENIVEVEGMGSISDDLNG